MTFNLNKQAITGDGDKPVPVVQQNQFNTTPVVNNDNSKTGNYYCLCKKITK